MSCGSSTGCAVDPACCDDLSPPSCDDSDASAGCGRWPNGVVRYRWGDAGSALDAAGRAMFLAASKDWQEATNGVISFLETETPPTITIQSGNSGDPYHACLQHGTCSIGFDSSNVYHEIGHTLLVAHTYNRYDKGHYHRTRPNSAGVCGGGNWAYASPDMRDLGPYDFKSTMMYRTNLPTQSRYDSSPVCQPPAAPNTCGDEPVNRCIPSAPPARPDGGAPACSTCITAQPQGYPTANDAAAVVELYRNLSDPAWKYFRRTVNEVVGSGQPFDYSLATNVTISTADPTPAIITWGGTILAVHVLGSDQHIYGKYNNNVVGDERNWSSWQDIGCCALSAPSAVSWANGRTDLVVRGTDDHVYIKTWINGSGWTSWGALGGTTTSAPAIASWGPNRLDVFIRDSQNHLLVKSCASGCTGGAAGFGASWRSDFPNGAFIGKPAVVTATANVVDIFVHGEDHRLYGNNYQSNNAAVGWYLVSNVPLGWKPSPANADLYSPAAATPVAGQIKVFARGVGTNDNMISVITGSAGTWGAWKVLGGNVVSSPGAVSNRLDAGRADLMAAMFEERSYDGGYDGGSLGIWWKEGVQAVAQGLPGTVRWAKPAGHLTLCGRFWPQVLRAARRCSIRVASCRTA